MSRQANLLGALGLAVADRIEAVFARTDGRGSTATAALVHLRLRPGENIDFLARVLAVTHPATVRLVDRLEDEGLVERRPAADGRARALVLTSSGEQAAVAALANRLTALSEVLEPLSAAERRQLEPLLEKLLRGVTEDRRTARHICRCCDFLTCDHPFCPVDRAANEVHLATIAAGPGVEG